MRAFAILLVLCCCFQFPARAEESFPTDAKFVVQLNVSEFANTDLGSKLVQVTQSMASQELGATKEKFIQKLEETLGFDPTVEIQTVTLLGSNYDTPEEGLRLVVQMRETTGNIEGFLLGVPGYSSQEVDGMTLHSLPLDDTQIHLTIHDSEDGRKRLLAATSESELMDLLHASQSSGGVWVLMPPVFARLELRELPQDLVQAVEGVENVTKLIRGVQLSVAEEVDSFGFELELQTDTEKKAEQIQQLLQGLRAMAGLFEEDIKEQDETAAMALEILDDVNIENQQEKVLIKAALPEDWVLTFLREEAGLPL